MVLAALINSLKIVGKKPEDLKLVVLGVGASGIACARIMLNYGVRDIVGFDRTGAVYPGRENLNPAKEWFAEHTNPDGFSGDLTQAMRGADMFLGLSGPRMLSPEQVGSMADDAIVLALSNPEPEIMPELIQGKARVIATGRSDYPNQVNNVLCFPGLFRGAFDAGAKRITEEMKLVAAHAIAEVIPTTRSTRTTSCPRSSTRRSRARSPRRSPRRRAAPATSASPARGSSSSLSQSR